MWQLPTIEYDQAQDLKSLTFDAPVSELNKLGSFDHQTTHRTIRFHVLEGRLRSSAASRRGTWRRPSDVADLPMSNAQRKVLAIASGGHG